MINTLLFIHLAIAILLIVVILLQRTGSDGLSGIGGGGGNMNVVTARSAANLLTKTTVILGVLFFANAILLANISGIKKSGIGEKLIEQTENGSPINGDNLPVAK